MTRPAPAQRTLAPVTDAPACDRGCTADGVVAGCPTHDAERPPPVEGQPPERTSMEKCSACDATFPVGSGQLVAHWQKEHQGKQAQPTATATPAPANANANQQQAPVNGKPAPAARGTAPAARTGALSARAAQPRPSSRMVLGQRRERPPGYRMFLWGEKKIGKTSFVVDAETVAFIPAETSPNVPDERIFPQPLQWSEIGEAVDEFMRGGHAFTGICLDTADAASALLVEHVKEKAKAGAGAAKGQIKYLSSDIGGGYGAEKKAVDAMIEEWRLLLAKLDRVRDLGFNVFILGHSVQGKEANPDGSDYPIWKPSLPDGVASTIVGWADVVGFAKKDVALRTVNRATKAGLAGAHMLYLQQERATFFAGNRFGLPPKIDLSYERFAVLMARRSTAEIAGIVQAVREKLERLPPDHTVEVMVQGQPSEVNVVQWVNRALAGTPSVGLLAKLDSRLQAIIADLGLDDDEQTEGGADEQQQQA